MQYRLIRNSRRKRIAISVDMEGMLIVKAPMHMSKKRIDAFVAENMGWIQARQREAEERSAARGPLKKLSDEELAELTIQAKDWFESAVSCWADSMHVRCGRVTIRKQRTRWGSCSRDGNLSFNCLLMLAPEDVRTYVVVHELCHRTEMNHSKRFWDLVETYMPDYREKKKWLAEHGQELLQRLPARS